MFNWLKRRKWLLVNMVLVGVIISMLGVQVIDEQDAVGRSVKIGIGNEKVITLGHVAYAAGSVDYTFDGTDDNVQFQAALDALPATGGRLVVVSAVQINFSAIVSRAIDNVTIEGSGRGTYFTYDDASPIFDAGAQSYWVFRDFRTDAGGLDISTATNWLKENITEGAVFIPLGFPKSVLSGTTTYIEGGIELNNPDSTVASVLRTCWHSSGSIEISHQDASGALVLTSGNSAGGANGDVVLGQVSTNASLPHVGRVYVRRSALADDTDNLISSHKFFLQGSRYPVGGPETKVELGVTFTPTDRANAVGRWVFDTGLDMAFDSMVYLGDTSNAGMTLGLTINQADNDDEILTFKSSDITQGGGAEPDTFATFAKNHPTRGGLIIKAYSDYLSTGTGSGIVFNTGVITLSGASNSVYQHHFKKADVTATTPQTVDNAATVYIDSAPEDIGSATITNKYALLVNTGLTKLGGNLNITGQTLFTGSILAQADGIAIVAKNADDNFLLLKARDNGVGTVEVARLMGAADPYFSIGGSQQFKFTNSGLAGFFSAAPVGQQNVPLTTPSVQDVIDALVALGLVEQSD